jgi:hypothetical protein
VTSTTYPRVTHKANVDISSDLHSLGIAVDAPDQQKEQRLFHVLVPIDFGCDGASQLVVEIILRDLTGNFE